jgi:hypothetical protein
MTAIWGPLGWTTLHSTAFAYPEAPSQSEKNLMTTWLDMFRDTITCPTCKGHFTTLLTNYRTQFPNFMGSRHDFVIFTFRAHNAVNRRLNKPIYASVEACVETLRAVVRTRSAQDYRTAYLNHITRHWKTFQDISGIVAVKKINEMRKIEVDYVVSRDTNFRPDIRSDIVVLPQDRLEREAGQEAPSRLVFSAQRAGGAGFRITAGGIRLLR